MTPKQVVDVAIEKGLAGISITDHDNIGGIEEAINYAQDRLEIIPGIEFSCRHDDEEIHILGYFIDFEDKKLIDLCKDLKDSRMARSVKILKKLNLLGFDISLSDIEKYQSKGFTGRFHIALELVNLGYVKNTNEAFDLYLGVGKPAYVERKILTPKKTIEFIKSMGGAAILAHPILLNHKKTVQKCIDWGIDGIECIHSKQSSKDSQYFLNLCKEHNLITTGGSDCHGILFNDELLLGKYFMESDKKLKSKEDLKCLQKNKQDKDNFPKQ